MIPLRRSPSAETLTAGDEVKPCQCAILHPLEMVQGAKVESLTATGLACHKLILRILTEGEMTDDEEEIF